MELTKATEYLESRKIHYKHIIRMAAAFDEIDEDRWSDAMSKLHDSAGRLDYVGDYDFGALALEAEASKSLSAKLKRFLLHHALLRAEWCTGDATARGEQLARVLHVGELKAELGACS